MTGTSGAALTSPTPARAEAAPGVPAAFRPAEIVEVEVSGPLPDLPPNDAARLLVVRLCGEPVGLVDLAPGDTGAAPEVARRIEQDLRGLLAEAARRHVTSPASLGPLSERGWPHQPCRYREQQEHLLQEAPGFTVVLCTRDRPDDAVRALTSLRELRYPRWEALVVDNSADASVLQPRVESLDLGMPLRYVHEQRPGLSVARNTALQHVTTPLVAFLDDDERADPSWLLALAGAFAEPEVACVSGLVLPLELDTPAQAAFETFGGHSKGRGFRRAVFDQTSLRQQPAVYPLPPFGVGANMAFRTDALRALGGFDTRLGAGSPLRGAEDTAVFTELLLRGQTMVYDPTAVTWHAHRRDEADLTDQLDGYARGLGGYYAALTLRHPRQLLALTRLLPRALRDLRTPSPADAGAAAPTGPTATAPAAHRQSPAVAEAVVRSHGRDFVRRVLTGYGLYLGLFLRAAARDRRTSR